MCMQSTNQSYPYSNQDLSKADRGRNNLRCCVAHKAEMMISDVQKLCKFGVRFGLLEVEDKDVYDCLNLLKAKFQEMARCSTEDEFELNSIDSEAD